MAFVVPLIYMGMILLEEPIVRQCQVPSGYWPWGLAAYVVIACRIHRSSAPGDITAWGSQASGR